MCYHLGANRIFYTKLEGGRNFCNTKCTLQFTEVLSRKCFWFQIEDQFVKCQKLCSVEVF